MGNIRGQSSLVFATSFPCTFFNMILARAAGAGYSFPSIYGGKEVLMVGIAFGTVARVFRAVLSFFRATTIDSNFVRVAPRRVPVNRLTRLLCPVHFLVTMGVHGQCCKLSILLTGYVKSLPGLRIIASVIFGLPTHLGEGKVCRRVVIGIVHV